MRRKVTSRSQAEEIARYGRSGNAGNTNGHSIRNGGTDAEEQFQARANDQGDKAFFDLLPVVQSGDVVPYIDGRGIEVRHVIGRLKVYDGGTGLQFVFAGVL